MKYKQFETSGNEGQARYEEAMLIIPANFLRYYFCCMHAPFPLLEVVVSTFI